VSIDRRAADGVRGYLEFAEAGQDLERSRGHLGPDAVARERDDARGHGRRASMFSRT
jgi:hypothetical protein